MRKKLSKPVPEQIEKPSHQATANVVIRLHENAGAWKWSLEQAFPVFAAFEKSDGSLDWKCKWEWQVILQTNSDEYLRMFLRYLEIRGLSIQERGE